MLTWNWNEKVGKITYENYETYLYNGNAMLIEMWEEKPEEKNGKYQLMNFLCDKGHFKNCLKDRNGDWLFENMRSVEIYEIKNKDMWEWIKECVKRGKQVTFLSRPF